MKIIEYKKDLGLDKKIKEFITNILFIEFNQKVDFVRPDLDDFDVYERSSGRMWLIINEDNVLGSIAIKMTNNNQAVL